MSFAERRLGGRPSAAGAFFVAFLAGAFWLQPSSPVLSSCPAPSSLPWRPAPALAALAGAFFAAFLAASSLSPSHGPFALPAGARPGCAGRCRPREARWRRGFRADQRRQLNHPVVAVLAVVEEGCERVLGELLGSSVATAYGAGRGNDRCRGLRRCSSRSLVASPVSEAAGSRVVDPPPTRTLDVLGGDRRGGTAPWRHRRRPIGQGGEAFVRSSTTSSARSTIGWSDRRPDQPARRRADRCRSRTSSGKTRLIAESRATAGSDCSAFLVDELTKVARPAA